MKHRFLYLLFLSNFTLSGCVAVSPPSTLFTQELATYRTLHNGSETTLNGENRQSIVPVDRNEKNQELNTLIVPTTVEGVRFTLLIHNQTGLSISVALSGQPSSTSLNTWNANENSSQIYQKNSAIPLYTDPFNGSLIFKLSLTAAIFSSWVIPEVALGMTDKVKSLSNCPFKEAEKSEKRLNNN